MNVPKLRFKEFNDEWINNCLSDIATITMGQSPSSKNYTSNKNNIILIQGNADLNNGHVVPRIFTTQITKTCNINDIIITVRAPVGDTAISDYNACIGRGVCAISGDKYIYHYLNYLKINDYWKKISKGSTIDSITSNDIRNLNINFPNSTETKKIVKTLDLLDKKIELQSKKIEDLKLFKTYTKNELFKNFDYKCKLKDILIKWSKRNKDNEINYVESISNKYGFVSQSEQFESRKVASKDLKNYYIIEKNVFGYNPSRLNVGSLALKIDDKISVVSPLYECFTTTQNKKFILEWFNSKYFQKETISKFEGGVRKTLNFSNLCDIEIGLPSMNNQKKYDEVFTAFDTKINLEKNKLNKLIELKRGLMQSMFV